jgi:hypothetical protein
MNKYGTLETDNGTYQIYFVAENNFFRFYKTMLAAGWKMVEDIPYERKGIKGYEVKVVK